MSLRGTRRTLRGAFSKITLIATTGFAMCACTERNDTLDVSSKAPSLSRREHSNVKYARVEPANSLGYAKVSLRSANAYAEGVIDKESVEIIAPGTSFLVTDITDARALLQFASKFLFVDLDQGPVDASLFATTDGYTFAEPFRSGLALVTTGDERFYINENGERPFNETYDHAETFHSDRALVYNGENKRIIDQQGKTSAVLHYDQVNPYTPERWQVTRIKNDVYLSGFVDLNGKEVVPLIYDDVGMFEADVNRAIVGTKGLYGFIDDSANVVIPLQYDYIEMFGQGKARVRRKGRVFFIDPKGNEVP